MELTQIRGRGTAHNPQNRFEQLAFDPEPGADPDAPGPETKFFRDTSRTIIAHNDSPDVGFTFSVNPYRGCEHGCIYCYARPSHEYLAFSAGLDFETRILVKEDAPELLRKALASPRWKPASISFSGVTDCYQPIERKLRITRRCLEVMLEFRNPFGVITKSHLVTRDLDILTEMARFDGVVVHLSITSLDEKLQRVFEPRAATPARRLAAVEKLAAAGVPVGVMIAPVVPGLTDHELPSILEAASAAGARTAGYIPLRLPYAVAGLFEQWLDTHFPERKSKVMNRVRGIRGGRMNDPRFGTRMTGEGQYAEQIRALFDAGARKHGLTGRRITLSTESFRRPAPHGQLGLFGD